jgi:hypothetical protein
VQAVHAEERIAELLQSGEITPDSLSWRDGMAEWLPLSRFQPAAPNPAFVPARRTEPLPLVSSRPLEAALAPARQAGSRRLPHMRFRRHPEPLTSILQIVLLLSIGVSGIDLIKAVARYHFISAGPPLLTLSPNLSVPSVVGSDELPLFYATVGLMVTVLFVYCLWLYQANINSRRFSPIVRFSRGWAVGCGFVPAVNLYMPCQVMQEIWKVSRNPRTWHNDRSSLLVGVWWALWLMLVCACLTFGFLYTQAGTTEGVASAVLAGVVLFAIQIVFLVIFLALITIIVRNQKRLVAAGQRKRDPLTPTPAPAP